MATSFSKDPDAVLDYAVDWSSWLVEGDTITGSEWTVADGLTMDDDSFTDTSAVIWLSGGTLGERYTVVNRITTEQGRVEDQTLMFAIKEH